MLMYRVSYDYYSREYGGINISEADFGIISRKASLIVDNITFNRLSKVDFGNLAEDMTDRINMCLCEVCDKIQASNEDGFLVDSVKSSESLANWSVSYDSKSVPSSVLKSFKNSVDMYLGGSFLTCAWC